MNIDIIRESVNLPLLNKGEHVVIHHVGAYNMTQWMQFISLRPNIVLIDMHEKCHVIREKETMETITALEKIPAHLKKF
jgi:diaminopimelate decarboxylase